ncbi:MAG: peroxiredoxin [FCB group bacterium]|nr:peroxiredoxin [FCB group bacterium]
MKIILILGVALVGFIFGKDHPVAVGDPAPDFTLRDQNGTEHRLSDYRGQPVVVYFYPKDDTPGCVKEACGIRDNFQDFSKTRIQVFGISYDNVASHKKFQDKYQLPFTLLADTTKQVAKLYGADGLFFASRKTFLIDEQGFIIKIYPKVSVTEHAQEILTDFQNLTSKD